MADVRDFVAYQEQAVDVLTFDFDASIVPDTNRYDLGLGSVQVGLTVALVSDSTVGLGATGGYPTGKLVKVEGTKCSVQCKGTMLLRYATGTPPIVGRGVQVDGAGNVISPAGGVRLATERGIVVSLGKTTDSTGVAAPTGYLFAAVYFS